MVGIEPILSPLRSGNQSPWSGPTARPKGRLFKVGVGKAVIVPVGVIRPIAAGPTHREPHVAVWSKDERLYDALARWSVNSSPAPMWPLVSMRAILSPSPNHSFSGPTITPDMATAALVV